MNAVPRMKPDSAIQARASGGAQQVAVVRGGAGEDPADDLLAVLDHEEQQHEREDQPR
jgi:hypothetical protein